MKGLRGVCLRLLLLAIVVSVGCQKEESPATNEAMPKPDASSAPPAVADEQAVAVAERVMRALGGEKAWQSTRFVSWHFFETRRHYWDRKTEDIRIESKDIVILMNLGTKKGRVQKAGVEITDSTEVAKYMDLGYGAWVNDSYWMFMPYKLRDPGVHLAYSGEKQLGDSLATDVLTMTFEEVGLTPRNKYEVFVSKESDLVVAWAYYQDRDDPEPKFMAEWNGWQRFGQIMLATDHGQDKNWDIHVHETLPESVFRSFEPVGA